jgi:hypothetical protein
MWEKIYKMKLGDSLSETRDDIFVTERIVRVPGGWIYSLIKPSFISSTFIPFDNEFM